MAINIQHVEDVSLFSLLTPLSSLFWAVGPIRPSLVRGLRPRNAPPKHAVPHRPGVDIRNRCLIERVQPVHVPPVPSDPLMCRPCACPRTRPNYGLHRTARPRACTASRTKTVNSSSHRWRRFPARLFPSQIWDAPVSSQLCRAFREVCYTACRRLTVHFRWIWRASW